MREAVAGRLLSEMGFLSLRWCNVPGSLVLVIAVVTLESYKCAPRRHNALRSRAPFPYTSHMHTPPPCFLTFECALGGDLHLNSSARFSSFPRENFNSIGGQKLAPAARALRRTPTQSRGHGVHFDRVWSPWSPPPAHALGLYARTAYIYIH